MGTTLLRLLQFSLVVASVSLLAICLPSILLQRDITHPEGIVPWSCWQVRSGLPLYSDWREWPHRFMPYGPLLCYPIGILFRLLGTDEYSFSIYFAGRLQSLAYAIGIGALMARILVGAGIPIGLAFAGAFAYLSLWTAIITAGLSFRADIPALFWALFAAMLVLSNRSRNSRLINTAALVLFVLSLAYKPALWAFPAAYSLFLIYQRKIKGMIAWAVSVWLAVGIYVLVGEVVTNGHFLLNQVGASSMGFSTDTLKVAVDLLFSQEDYPLFTWDILMRIIGGVVLAIVFIRKGHDPLAVGFSIYFLTALVINIATMLKVGSGLNYVLEAYVLSGIVFGIAIARVWGNDKIQTHPAVRSGFAVFLLLFFIVPMPYHIFKNVQATLDLVKADKTTTAYSELLKLPHTALLGDLAFTHQSPEAHAISDPLPYVQLTKRGLIPKEPLAKRITSQTFSHIVLSPGTSYLFAAPEKAKWAGDLLQAHYQRKIQYPEYEVWVPKPGDSTSTSTVTNPAPPE